MKKLLGIVVLGLLWCNLSIAIENLEIKNTNSETEVIQIKENYKLSCEIDLVDFSGIYSVHSNEKDKVLSSFLLDFKEDGKIFISTSRKINKKGKLSKPDFKIEYSSDLDEEIKKEIKPLKKLFKSSLSNGLLNRDIYGSSLTPGRKISKSSSIRSTASMSLLAVMTGEKRFKKMKASIYEEFLGYTMLGNEKFYIVEEGSEFSHPDKSFLEDYMEDVFPNYILIHSKSGLSIIINEETIPKCSVVYNDKLLTEFDTSELFLTGGSKNSIFLNTAEKKPTVKTKKKKVAKKEPKQEEFKPKKTSKQSKSKKIKKIIKIETQESINKNISLWEKNVLAAIEKEKSDPYCKLVDKKPKLNELVAKGGSLFKKNYCIKKSDLLKLGEYKKFNAPNFILEEMGGCKSNTCVGNEAGKNVYKIFVQKTPIYHAKHPGDMIKGMAWFEILYQTKLKKLQKILKRYDAQKYEGLMKLKKKNHEKQIYSLIKLNNGRIKMRKALGFTVYNDLYEVIEGQWLLAEFLNKDKLEISKVKMTPEMFKRKELIEKYKTVLAKYKQKLDEEKDKKIN
jgi:hypothetical protein